MPDISSPRSAIVLSCDENYVPLARGLVLSLAECGCPGERFDVVLIDIGCSEPSLDWMRSRGVRVVPFDSGCLPADVLDVIQPQQRAQVLRPWIPDLVTGYERYVWFDSDIWVQDGQVLSVLHAALDAVPDKILLAPGISHFNLRLYLDTQFLIDMQRRWFSACYEAPFAEETARKVHFCSGVFAMNRACTVWELWRREIAALYPKVAAHAPALLHMTEQIALNGVVRRHDLALPFDPLFNFHCNSGGMARDPRSGRVVTTFSVPSRDIGVLHLANWSFLKDQYIEAGLLYRKGDYITPEEWARIRAIPVRSA